MKYKAVGTVTHLTDTKTIQMKNGDELRVRTVCLSIDDDDGYDPKTLAIEMFRDKCDLDIMVGQIMQAHFYIESNQSNSDSSRWWTSAKLISVSSDDMKPPIQGEPVGEVSPPPQQADEQQDDGDDVPF